MTIIVGLNGYEIEATQEDVVTTSRDRPQRQDGR